MTDNNDRNTSEAPKRLDEKVVIFDREGSGLGESDLAVPPNDEEIVESGVPEAKGVDLLGVEEYGELVILDVVTVVDIVGIVDHEDHETVEAPGCHFVLKIVEGCNLQPATASTQIRKKEEHHALFEFSEIDGLTIGRRVGVLVDQRE